MYVAGGTTTLLDQVIIPVIADGADASLPAVEDLSSGITASGTYVDTTKQVEKLAYRYGKVVQAHLTFYAKTALSSAVTLFSGLPGMNKTMQFVGMNSHNENACCICGKGDRGISDVVCRSDSRQGTLSG